MKYSIFVLILQSFLIIKNIFIIFHNLKTGFLWTLIASVSAGFNILYLNFAKGTSTVLHDVSTRFPLFSMRFPPAFHIDGFSPQNQTDPFHLCRQSRKTPLHRSVSIEKNTAGLSPCRVDLLGFIGPVRQAISPMPSACRINNVRHRSNDTYRSGS